MKEMQAKTLSVVMILLFVNFMFANTIFVHTHRISDSRVVFHSHPYSASSQHTHSESDLSLISAFNAATTSAEAVDSAPVAGITLPSVTLECRYVRAHVCADGLDAVSRGPPAA